MTFEQWILSHFGVVAEPKDYYDNEKIITAQAAWNAALEEAAKAALSERPGLPTPGSWEPPLSDYREGKYGLSGITC